MFILQHIGLMYDNFTRLISTNVIEFTNSFQNQLHFVFVGLTVYDSIWVLKDFV